MREFILLALSAKTTPDFDLNNMPLEGRIDLVCRCISNALFVSNHMRSDSVIHVCLNGSPSELSPKLISFYGDSLRGMEWDERSIGIFIKKALEAGKDLKIGEEKKIQGGLFVSKKAFETLIREKAESNENDIFYLNEKGKDIRETKFSIDKNNIFIFGDFNGLPKNTEKLLKRLGIKNITLSPISLMASHCPILVHNELDRN